MKPTMGHKQITKILFNDGNERQFCLNCGCEEHEMKIYPSCEEYLKPNKTEDQLNSCPEGQSQETHFCNDCANVMYCGKRKPNVKIRCEFFEEASWVIPPKS